MPNITDKDRDRRFAEIIRALLRSADAGRVDVVGEGSERSIVIREGVPTTGRFATTVGDVVEALFHADEN